MLHAQKHGYDAMVLLIDHDNQRERKQELSKAQDDLRATIIPRAVGVAIITFDAWMLADEKALTLALGAPVQRQPDPETTRDAKAQCAKLRDDCDSNLSLTELYSQLSENIDLELLAERCSAGFRPFSERVRGMAAQVSSRLS